MHPSSLPRLSLSLCSKVKTARLACLQLSILSLPALDVTVQLNNLAAWERLNQMHRLCPKWHPIPYLEPYGPRSKVVGNRVPFGTQQKKTTQWALTEKYLPGQVNRALGGGEQRTVWSP